MEFVVGILCFGLAGGWAAVAVRRGGRVRDATLWGAAALQLVVLFTLGLDWGYSWVEATALDLALEKNPWIAVPHALAMLCLVGLLRWGIRFAPWAALLSALQTFLFIPILLSVERKTSMSFLAAAPMVAMFAASTASFLFLPAACGLIPHPGSRWHRIAFGPRAGLIAAIAGLRDLGLDVRAPDSLFESGAASGRVGGAGIEVSSVPALFPPAYGLRVRVRSPGGVPGPVPPVPGFAPRERVHVVDGLLEYEGWTPAAFSVEGDRLKSFLLESARP